MLQAFMREHPRGPPGMALKVRSPWTCLQAPRGCSSPLPCLAATTVLDAGQPCCKGACSGVRNQQALGRGWSSLSI